MEYTIKKLSELAGVTSRTLRHYDAIGLLKPKRINSSNYRIYGSKEVERLQQILFYREFDLPLEEIKRILDDSHYDTEGSLLAHRQALLQKRQRLDLLLQTIDRTLADQRGERTMTDKEKFEGFKKKQLQENEKNYGEEIRERYGADTVEKSNQKFASLTEEQHQKLQLMANQILADLKTELQTGDPTSKEAHALAALHKEWLTYTWPSYTKEAHRGLADMYVADERFTSYYDEPAGIGAAQFLRDAIYAYTTE